MAKCKGDRVWTGGERGDECEVGWGGLGLGGLGGGGGMREIGRAHV